MKIKDLYLYVPKSQVERVAHHYRVSFNDDEDAEKITKLDSSKVRAVGQKYARGIKEALDENENILEKYQDLKSEYNKVLFSNYSRDKQIGDLKDTIKTLRNLLNEEKKDASDIKKMFQEILNKPEPKNFHHSICVKTDVLKQVRHPQEYEQELKRKLAIELAEKLIEEKVITMTKRHQINEEAAVYTCFVRLYEYLR